MPETKAGIDNAADLSLLIDAALAAGKIACQFVGPETKRWDKPDGAGPVTEADLAVNRLLEDTLQTARPDYGWLSEETEDSSQRLNKSHVFVVDPIDGTRSFAAGSKTWAHSLAIVEDGSPRAAVIYLPQRDLLYVAASNKGATCNGVPLGLGTPPALDDAHVLATKITMQPENWTQLDIPKFTRSHRPSLAYRMARVADGSYDAMITLRGTWDWDIAAGDLILREAGATTSDQFGAALRFNSKGAQNTGVVASTPPLHKGLLQRLNVASNRSQDL